MDGLGKKHLLVLQNHSRYGLQLLYNTFLNTKEEVERDENHSIDGHYIKERFGYVLFFKSEEKLYLHVKGNTYPLQEPNCEMTYSRYGIISVFKVKISNKTIFSRIYKWKMMSIDGFFSDFYGEDILDFYQFIRNIIIDEEKCKRVYNGKEF